MVDVVIWFCNLFGSGYEDLITLMGKVGKRSGRPNAGTKVRGII